MHEIIEPTFWIALITIIDNTKLYAFHDIV